MPDRPSVDPELLRRYGRSPDTVAESAEPADEFLRLACLTYGADSGERRARARELLAGQPELVRASIHTAAAGADAATVRALLAADPALSQVEGGPFDWPPLLYLTYARYDPDVTEAATLDTARALLEAGADPDAGFLWHGLVPPFTALTGVFGEGEGGPDGQPAHPHAPALAALLLDAGADPNDGQTLYNRMFGADNSHLELLLRHGLGRRPGGTWYARLGAALAPPDEQLHTLLAWAVTHDQLARVALLLDNGLDPSGVGPDGYTLAQYAALYGRTGIAELLRARGVPPPELDPPDQLLAAVFAGDEATVAAAPEPVRAQARTRRPGVLVWAAAQRDTDAVRRLLDLGWPVDARGRGDAPVEQGWETALHHAAGNGDNPTVRLLLDRGADTTVVDQRFAATAQGWAEYFGHSGTARLLEAVVACPPGEAPPP